MLPVLFIWDSKAMYLGPSFDNGTHSHNAYQVVVALDGTTRVEIDGIWLENTIFVIRPNTKHRVQFFGVVAVLLMDAEVTTRGDDFIATRLRPDTLSELKACYAELYSSEQALAVYKKVTAEVGLAVDILNSSIDDRIKKCLNFINQNLNENLSMEMVCRLNGISESSFSHLFSKEVGIPFRRYVLWKRIKESISLYLKGNKSLTDVSLEMGFSDQAHFTKSFRDVFGVKPTFVFRNKLKILYYLKRIRIS